MNMLVPVHIIMGLYFSMENIYNHVC